MKSTRSNVDDNLRSSNNLKYEHQEMQKGLASCEIASYSLNNSARYPAGEKHSRACDQVGDREYSMGFTVEGPANQNGTTSARSVSEGESRIKVAVGNTILRASDARRNGRRRSEAVLA